MPCPRTDSLVTSNKAVLRTAHTRLDTLTMFLKLLCALVVILLSAYTYALSKRLGRSRFEPDKRRSKPFPTDEGLLRSSANWAEIDVLQDSGVEEPTHKQYLVTGACGSFGVWLVQILHRRGERKIYCLDVAPMPPALSALDGVHYLKCNITSAQDVDHAFEEARPDV